MSEINYLIAIIYGIIQGITEFLPISSSAHLALLPKFFHFKDPGIIFDLAMHVGTALSIFVYFYREVIILIKEFFSLFNFYKKRTQNPKNYFLKNMLISTSATFVVVIAIRSFALEYGRSTELIAINLLVFGILMWIADSRSKGKGNFLMISSLQVTRAIMIGVFQGFAIFPGVSRSGATLTISRFIHLSREEAARYSFLLSLPIIFGGFLIKSKEFLNNGHFDIQSAILGVVVSFVVGILTIHFFLKLISKIGLWIFAFYRIVLAIYLLFFFTAV